MPGDYPIRPFRPDDLPRLQDITAETFGPVSIDKNMERLLGPFGHGGWQSRKVEAVAEDCRLQPDGVFVAEDPSAGERVVGYVTTRLNPTSLVGWIPNLAVDPAHQGRGLGRLLLQTALTSSGGAACRPRRSRRSSRTRSARPSTRASGSKRSRGRFTTRCDSTPGKP